MIHETDRLILRPWKEEDAFWVYTYCKDPIIGNMAGFPVHTSMEDSRNIVQNVLMGPLSYAIVLKEENHVIGSITIRIGENSNLPISENEADLGYWIGKEYWKHGYATEACKEMVRYAFEELKVDNLWCGYFDGNLSSKRVQEKAGFQYHHTNYDVFWPIMHRTYIEHVNCLTNKKYYIDKL